MFYNDGADSYDSFESHCIETRLTFSWLPRKCWLSGNSIWFKKAYKKTAMWTGPGTPIYEDRWYDKDIYIISKLTA